jgi:hypothetical protein
MSFNLLGLHATAIANTLQDKGFNCTAMSLEAGPITIPNVRLTQDFRRKANARAFISSMSLFDPKTKDTPLSSELMAHIASFLQEKVPRELILNGFKFSKDGHSAALEKILFQAQVYLREPLSQSTYEALKNAANGTPDRWQRAMLDAAIATGKFPVVVYSPRPAVTFSADSSSATPKRDRAETYSAERYGNKKTKVSKGDADFEAAFESSASECLAPKKKRKNADARALEDSKYILKTFTPRTKNRQEEQPEAIRRNPKRTCRK